MSQGPGGVARHRESGRVARHRESSGVARHREVPGPGEERGQGFADAIWEMVRRIPAGRATTYGQLAEAWYGVAKGARRVGQAMARCPEGLPWWRVVHADGSMKGGPGSDEQLARLAEEGVPVTAERRVDWARSGGPWSPAQQLVQKRRPKP